MDDECLMSVVNGSGNSGEKLEALPETQGSSVGVFVDGDTIDVLHHRVGASVRGHPSVVEARDVGVLEVRDDLPLLGEASQSLGVPGPGVHDLDGY